MSENRFADAVALLMKASDRMALYDPNTVVREEIDAFIMTVHPLECGPLATDAALKVATRGQIEAFRKENFIHAHVGEIPDAGLEAWAVESNMVLDYLCGL